MTRTLVWIRGKDLRLADHLPLLDAAAAGEVIPLFVLDPFFFAPKRAVELPNRIHFLLESLRELAGRIEALGSKLVLVEGKSVEQVPKWAERWKVDQVFAHRWVEPFARERDDRVRRALKVPFTLYEGETLHPLGSLRTGQGTPFSVYTAFARAHERQVTIDAPARAPKSLPPLPKGLEYPSATIPTAQSLGVTVSPLVLPAGEVAARERLRRFVNERAARYPDERNRLDLDTTSRLSADLKFGTLSARTVFRAVQDALGHSKAALVYLNELRWRDFAHSTLWDRPNLLEVPFQPRFATFPWRHDDKLWSAWAEGRTGYPVVDASARQLLQEGFVHNRARMISASFLTKHLLIDFRMGEAHYLKYLVDGDWAQNDLGWQWSAGCGCDAQPYFRVFNPITQGERFDPNGEYIRRWLPELAQVDDAYIHKPWEAPSPPKDYPAPIVAHAEARARFLALAQHHLAEVKQMQLSLD